MKRTAADYGMIPILLICFIPLSMVVITLIFGTLHQRKDPSQTCAWVCTDTQEKLDE